MQYVVAFNRDEYIQYLRRNQLRDRHDACYISEPRSLQGLSGVEICITPRASLRCDWNEILEGLNCSVFAQNTWHIVDDPRNNSSEESQTGNLSDFAQQFVYISNTPEPPRVTSPTVFRDSEQIWFDLVDLEMYAWCRMTPEDQAKLEVLIDMAEQEEYTRDTVGWINQCKRIYEAIEGIQDGTQVGNYIWSETHQQWRYNNAD